MNQRHKSITALSHFEPLQPIQLGAKIPSSLFFGQCKLLDAYGLPSKGHCSCGAGRLAIGAKTTANPIRDHRGAVSVQFVSRSSAIDEQDVVDGHAIGDKASANRRVAGLMPEGGTCCISQAGSQGPTLIGGE